jgi:hypothetical protein
MTPSVSGVKNLNLARVTRERMHTVAGIESPYFHMASGLVIAIGGPNATVATQSAALVMEMPLIAKASERDNIENAAKYAQRDKSPGMLTILGKVPLARALMPKARSAIPHASDNRASVRDGW